MRWLAVKRNRGSSIHACDQSEAVATIIERQYTANCSRLAKGEKSMNIVLSIMGIDLSILVDRKLRSP